jgi:hypothetical protein
LRSRVATLRNVVSKRWLKIKNRAHPSILRVREAIAYGNKRRA